MSGVKRLILALLLLASPALAEGDPKAPPPAAPVKAKTPAPKAAIPAAPIPYTTYAGLSPDMAKALTPEANPRDATPGVAATPDMLPQPAETSLSAAPPPPPPPPEAASAPQAARMPPVADEISLRCDTRITEGRKLVSSGSFYIDLFLSPVFPDEHATFKFLFADPNHPSLIRDTICLDTVCSAEVTGQAYYLVDSRTRKGKALRITLDRLQGAFYAEKVDGGRHFGEQGYCTPQALPGVKF